MPAHTIAPTVPLGQQGSFPFTKPVCGTQAGPRVSSGTLSDASQASSLPRLQLISVPLLFCSLLHCTTVAPCSADPAKHSVLAPLVFPSVTYHLGYRREELIGQSWYSLLHPEDTDLAAAQHRAVGECQAWERTCLSLATLKPGCPGQKKQSEFSPARCGSLLRKGQSRELVTHPTHCL